MKDYYHTKDEFDAVGMTNYREHIKDYFYRGRLMPFSVSRQNSEPFYFAFSDQLLHLMLHDMSRIEKAYECALKYGFRGYSKGGKNGVFYLRKQDKRLIKAVESTLEENASDIAYALDCTMDEIDELKRVKIVYHNTSGERIVGVMSLRTQTAIFLDFATY